LDVAEFFIKDPNVSICKTILQHNINLMSQNFGTNYILSVQNSSCVNISRWWF